ncbi:AraC family transcriptional regulator [Permianibacter sp. IMCC34836]|uniref:AraC family transcriptional regulator n=1 Tax=Permianibacter fluminis TaxID=2738515 RepID=UPI0015578F96|nr:GyrI-like domain-containing protein [Permianibacter fluminis]NQD36312.1 AraC family transcriptional regulator [Permianibacter fluminis]
MDSDLANPHRAEYLARVNRVIDYVAAHLDGDLSLPTLAAVAHFSPFYFHRIFKAMTGETLSQFIARTRLARACFLLRNQPERSVTSIAYDCGFSSPATFARAFRQEFATTAGAWRLQADADRKIGKLLGKPGKAPMIRQLYRAPASQPLAWRIEMQNGQTLNVTVETLVERNVAYIRHFGRYHQDVELFERLFGRLLTWAAPRGLVNFPQSEALTVFGGHPDSTDPEQLRVDVCLTVPVGTAVGGAIGCRTLSGGQYAVVHIEAPLADCYAAWDVAFNEWLPASGFQPDDRDYFLNHRNDPKSHPRQWHIVDMCIPVKPL